MTNLFGGCDNSMWLILMVLCCCQGSGVGGAGLSNCLCDILPLLLLLQCCCPGGGNPCGGFGSCK